VTRCAVVATVVALLAVTTAGAQTRALPQRLGPDARVAIERVIDSASLAGLPTLPLVDKAAEGVLKGADDQRIVIAVRGLARELGEARDVLGSAADGALLGATASALHAGARADELRQIARPGGAAPPDAHTVAAAFVALADLVTKRISPVAATSAVAELLRRRAKDADFTALRGDVDRDIRGGVAPDVALTNRTQARVQVLDAIPLDRSPVKRPPPLL
jgi:hypothetical protein